MKQWDEAPYMADIESPACEWYSCQLLIRYSVQTNSKEIYGWRSTNESFEIMFCKNLAIAVARVSEMRMKTMRMGRRKSPRTHIFSFYKYKQRFTIEWMCLDLFFGLWTESYSIKGVRTCTPPRWSLWTKGLLGSTVFSSKEADASSCEVILVQPYPCWRCKGHTMYFDTKTIHPSLLFVASWSKRLIGQRLAQFWREKISDDPNGNDGRIPASQN